MPESNKPELLPCPFCQTTDLSIFDQRGIAWIQCNACDADGSAKDDLPEAVAAWNNRPASSEQQAAQQEQASEETT